MIKVISCEMIRQNKFIYDVAFLCERGGRPTNEDSIVVEYNQDKLLISVADGLGAHGGGDIASKIATNIAKKEYMVINRPTFKNQYRIFEHINSAIKLEQTDEVKMKTTLACVLFKNKWLYAAHLGDTRIYNFKSDMITYLTVDHSVAYDEVMKNNGTLDDIRKNPNRHILKAALGVGKIRPPDVFKQKVKPNIAILICSDGFWEYVNEDDMMKTLANTKNSHDWLEEMLRCYYERANEFNDNYSAICLRIKKL